MVIEFIVALHFGVSLAHLAWDIHCERTRSRD
jgi:hypothetical protein